LLRHPEVLAVFGELRRMGQAPAAILRGAAQDARLLRMTEVITDRAKNRRGGILMFNRNLPRVCGLILGVSMMMAVPAGADPLKDEIAPTGKLRVAIAISPAGGAFWSTKTEAGGYAGVPVDLGKEMAAQLGVPVEYVAHQNSGQIVDAASKGTWDVTFLPKDPEREGRMSFGPIYEVAEATYIVKAGSPATNFQSLDQPGVKIAAVNNTTTMRGAIAHLKNAKVTGYQTYDEIFGLLKNGEVDAFALSRDQLHAMAKKIPGTRVLDETFKQTVTAVAVPPNHPLALAFAAKFLTDATSNGTLRKAYDNNGLKDNPIRTVTKQ
jgi:polar amino acid transport system substrate-binding protein